jgi:prepilin-type N-terminal cleavage/methylation domain-containing protein
MTGAYKKEGKGFTLIELLTVIAIIGILAAIAIMQLTSYKKKGYNAEANADARTAYTAARAYFIEYPTATVDNASLAAYGYKQSFHVTTNIAHGAEATFIFTAIGNANGGSGDITYTIDKDGNITH